MSAWAVIFATLWSLCAYCIGVSVGRRWEREVRGGS